MTIDTTFVVVAVVVWLMTCLTSYQVGKTTGYTQCMLDDMAAGGPWR